MSGTVVRPALPAPALSSTFYSSVASLGESVDDTVIPNSETWEVTKFIGSAAYVDDTTASLYWDHTGAGETLLATTHGDAAIPLFTQLTGDGTKKLTIVLTNDTAAARKLGGRWEARKA